MSRRSNERPAWKSRPLTPEERGLFWEAFVAVIPAVVLIAYVIIVILIVIFSGREG